MRKIQIHKRQETQVKMDSALNLSDRKLTEDELYVLALGLIFQPVLATPPVIDTIAATEVVADNKLSVSHMARNRLHN